MSGYKRHHMEYKSETNGSPKTGKFEKERNGKDDGSVLSSENQGVRPVDAVSIVNRSPGSFAEI